MKQILKKIKRSSRKGPKNQELEKAILKEFILIREEKIAIGYETLKKVCLNVAENIGLSDFKSSNGFIEKFLARNNIKKRVATHYIQKVTKEVLDNTNKFLKNILKFRLEYTRKMLEDTTMSKPISK